MRHIFHNNPTACNFSKLGDPCTNSTPGAATKTNETMNLQRTQHSFLYRHGLLIVFSSLLLLAFNRTNHNGQVGV